jgi:hypothetical protein
LKKLITLSETLEAEEVKWATSGQFNI